MKPKGRRIYACDVDGCSYKCYAESTFYYHKKKSHQGVTERKKPTTSQSGESLKSLAQSVSVASLISINYNFFIKRSTGLIFTN